MSGPLLKSVTKQSHYGGVFTVGRVLTGTSTRMCSLTNSLSITAVDSPLVASRVLTGT